MTEPPKAPGHKESRSTPQEASNESAGRRNDAIAPPASKGLTLEDLMKKLLADPRCRIVKPSGKGFVIGGAKPPQK
jgi:hypothetical protein